ncbi:MAG: hypothetical protein Ct9H300mP17_06330 [Candidatus Nitrosopelagicus sp.]|nr:MAG: hypothetical protein Ct9H300mP17_06330 [Candidatus Nitrosopelagicus sp.]
MGKPCIVGCAELKINYENNTCTANGITVKENERVSIDGVRHSIFGEVQQSNQKSQKIFKQFLAGHKIQNS